MDAFIVTLEGPVGAGRVENTIRSLRSPNSSAGLKAIALLLNFRGCRLAALL